MMNVENIDPNDSVGYWLFYAQRCLAYASAETMRKHCMEQGKPYVVTPPQWGVLLLLHGKDGFTIGTISQLRGLDAPTVTGIIKRLEQAELVERRHDREDRRVVRVYLTNEGRDIMQSLLPIIQSFNDEMLGGFSTSETQMLLSMLRRLIANISDETLGTGDRFNLLLDYRPAKVDV